MTEPKLLTEADAQYFARVARQCDTSVFVAKLRERGLVADDPVDPDLLEAREIATDHAAKFGHDYVRYPDDDAAVVQIAFAALKRGRQLEQPKPLTQEMVVKAHQKALGDFGSLSIHRLHTALVEQMK